MVVEGLRGYVQAVAGLSEVTRQRARELAQALLTSTQGGLPPGAAALPGQVSGLAEDILATARGNRSLLLDLVRTEVDRSIGALGMTPPAEVDRMRQRIVTLERRIEELEAGGRGARPEAASRRAPTTAAARAAQKAAARKTAARTAAAGRAAAGKTTAGKTTAGKTTAGKTTAGKTTAGKTTAGKTTAGKTTAGKTTAGKTTTGKTASTASSRRPARSGPVGQGLA
jgi:hypothetical protein